MDRAFRSSILAALGFWGRRSSASSFQCGYSCFGSNPDLHLRGYTAEAAAAEEVADGIRGLPLSGRGGGRVGWDLLGAKEYLDYRRSLYGEITHKALLVDAVGTLLIPSQPMAQIYRQFGEKYGVHFSEDEILNRYRWAYEQPWGRSRLRYVDDGRPFWQFIVTSSTGCSDSQYFEELYEYYTTDKAWHLCDPDAEKVFEAIREAGVKVALVSNFDTRLRPLLRALKCDHWFDAVAVSAEVAAEKPNPTIFLKACELLEVKPEDAVHVGDDRRNDIWGARDAGCDAWLWGSDVHSFKEALFVEFLRRFSDKSTKVRLSSLEWAKASYQANASIAEAHSILVAVEGSLLDFDDRVRTQAVAVICKASSNLSCFLSEVVLKAIKHLCDKKISVKEKCNAKSSGDV